jgi:hypothetical protein
MYSDWQVPSRLNSPFGSLRDNIDVDFFEPDGGILRTEDSSMNHSFERYIGIDYSGAQTPNLCTQISLTVAVSFGCHDLFLVSA